MTQGQKANKLFDKVYGCLVGGLIGDALGGPTEGLTYAQIQERFGQITDFLPYRGLPAGSCTDDSMLKHMLCTAIIRKGHRIHVEDWAEVWLEQMNPRGPFSTPVVNSFYKMLVQGVPPREAGRGNRISNCSPMCIAPIGILNACDPAQAVFDTYEVTQVIDSGVAQDAAAAVTAAVAAAFWDDATPESVVAASTAHLRRGSEIPSFIHRALDLAKTTGTYEPFREQFYENYLQPYISNDPRESVPVTLALFLLADGDPVKAVRYGANFGRDADTIATMAGAVAGALRGGSSLPQNWVASVTSVNPMDQRQLAEDLCEVVLDVVSKAEERARAIVSLMK